MQAPTVPLSTGVSLSTYGNANVSSLTLPTPASGRSGALEALRPLQLLALTAYSWRP